MNAVASLKNISEFQEDSFTLYFILFCVCLQELKCLADDHLKTGKLQYLIHTKVGDGPKVLTDPASSLLDCTTGLPKGLESNAQGRNNISNVWNQSRKIVHECVQTYSTITSVFKYFTNKR